MPVWTLCSLFYTAASEALQKTTYERKRRGRHDLEQVGSVEKSGPWAVVVATDNIGLCASVTPKIAYAASSAPEQFESGGRFCG